MLSGGLDEALEKSNAGISDNNSYKTSNREHPRASSQILRSTENLNNKRHAQRM